MQNTLLKKPKKRSRLSLLGFLTFALISSHFLLLPIYRGFLFGDDYLFVRDAKTPGDFDSVTKTMWLVGSEKWRPISTTTLVLLSRIFNFDFASYQWTNRAFLFVVGLIAALLAQSLTRSKSIKFIFFLLVIASPMTWLGQTSVYGSMELTALLLVLLAIAILVSPSLIEIQSSASLNVVAILLFSAGLAHERFIIVAVAVWAALLMKRDRYEKWARKSWVLLLVPTSHMFLRVFVLRIDPFVGGGESQLSETAGRWIISHFITSIEMVFGLHSGTGVFYGDSTLASIAKSNDRQTFQIYLLCFVLIALVLRSHFWAKTRGGKIRPNDSMLLFVIGISLLLPAATVAERIEARWIFAPAICFALSILTLVSSMNVNEKNRVRNFEFFFVSLIFLVPAVLYLHDSADYLLLRNQHNMVLETAEKISEEYSTWGLLLSQSDSSMPLSWQFGYGSTFSQLRNRPSFVLFADSFSVCPKLKVKYTCFKFSLNGPSLAALIQETEVSPEADSIDRP